LTAGPRRRLAQANVARFRAPLADPVMREFAARIAATNALAERSPGFVWRHAGGPPEALDVFRDYAAPFDRDRLFFNMSVWESVEALRAYVFDTAHARLLRDRARWMEPFARPSLALWWIAADRRPTVDDALARLETLAARGPTAEAFTFERLFPAPA
jgi:hypothetical protein